jgi:hypothetical protein
MAPLETQPTPYLRGYWHGFNYTAGRWSRWQMENQPRLDTPFAAGFWAGFDDFHYLVTGALPDEVF